MTVYLKIKAPIFGFGKIKVVSTKAYRKLTPEAKMTMLTQALKALRKEHDKAATEERIAWRDEDILNAEAYQARQ